MVNTESAKIERYSNEKVEADVDSDQDVKLSREESHRTIPWYGYVWDSFGKPAEGMFLFLFPFSFRWKTLSFCPGRIER